MRKLICFAHRGASGHEPENTLLSVGKALELGAEWIEVDVYAVENELVVIHDERLERTTNGKGFVTQHSLAYLRSLDAGMGERIPYLREVFDLVRHRAGINVEIKGKNTVAPLVSLIDDYVNTRDWSYGQILVSSFDHNELMKVNSLQPEVKLGALCASLPFDCIHFAQELACYSVHLSMEFLDKRIVDDAHRRAEEIIGAAREEAESYKARLKQQIAEKSEREKETLLSDARAEAARLFEKTRAEARASVENERREAAKRTKKADEALVAAKVKAREILDGAQLEAEQSAARVRDEAERRGKALLEEAKGRAAEIVERARTDAGKGRISATVDVETAGENGQKKLIHKLMKKVKAGSYTDDYQAESGELVIGRMAAVLVSDAEQEARALLKRAQAEAERLRAEHAGKLDETKRECDALLQDAEREARRTTAAAEREANVLKREIEQLKRLRNALEEEVRLASAAQNDTQQTSPSI